MIKLIMPKFTFHNSPRVDRELEIQTYSQTHSRVQSMTLKKSVDINRLLNRVKIDQQNEKKQKVIFLGSAILIVGMTGLLFL
tara:strand:- start:90 stop:335 length:246 start_codon:yes stop_codon:yes gene_type:complete